MFKDISNKIVDKIKMDKVSLQPKIFDYKSFAFWLSFAFLIILGGITFSLILVAITFGEESFRLSPMAPSGIFKIIISTVPYIWIIFFGLFAYFGFKSFRLTSKGYRYEFSMILLVIFLASFLLGSFLHILGLNKMINQFMSKKVPFFHQIAPTKEGQWARPEIGMLGGKIVETGNNFIVIENFRDKRIMVIYSQESLISGDVRLEKGEMIRILGKKVDKKIFQADVIQNWEKDFGPKMDRKIKELRLK